MTDRGFNEGKRLEESVDKDQRIINRVKSFNKPTPADRIKTGKQVLHVLQLLCVR
jgi:hypothetical protein